MWSIPANDLCATSVGAWRVRPGARALGAWSLSLCKRRAFLSFSVFRIFITKPHILAFASSRHRRSHSFSTTHARDPLSSRISRLDVPQHLQHYNIRHQDVLQDSPSQRSLRSCGCSVCCPDLHQRAQPDHRRPSPGYHLCDQRHHQREYLVLQCNMENNVLTSHSP